MKALTPILRDGIDQALPSRPRGACFGRHLQLATPGHPVEQIVHVPLLKIGVELAVRLGDAVKLIAGPRASLKQPEEMQLFMHE